MTKMSGKVVRLPDAPKLIHGTSVAHANVCALIRGPSGSGKSDLALRCLVHALSPVIPGPVRLVADDYTQVFRKGSYLEASAPETIHGKLEVRGIGIIDVKPLASSRLAMVVELVEDAKIARLPDPAPSTQILGVQLPVMNLHAFEGSAAAKLLVALARCAEPPSQS